jgi:GT2 family glycosyltransferase
MSAAVRVCALLTCFNRRDKTLACLRSLSASVGLDGIALSAILVDDGSTDGTSDAVAGEFPWVRVLRVGAAEEALFWCRGMHRAFSAALETGYDHYLWLNDDTMLEPDALARLLATSGRLRRVTGAAAIVVGSTRDAATGAVTYGGERRPSTWRPFRVERLQPASTAQRCDSMTGNIVLIPADVALRVGNIDAVFEHSMGDTDYALRARRRGVQVWADAGTHGLCSDNSPTGTWCDASQPLRARWRDMLGRKGLPWRSWLVFTRRHAGLLWPIYFASPYVKVVAQGLWRAALPLRQRGLP